jgi:DNA-binding SARP family transcriptional activator
MERLYLRLFGTFQFESEGGRVFLLPTKKTKALLAYLAYYDGQPHERAKLAALLWEDSGEMQARESLRQSLSLVRKALSPRHAHALITRGDTVELKSGVLLVDAVEFERLVASTEIANLGQAVQLYQGKFMEGFDLRASEFEGWLSSVRQQLNEKAIDALNKLLSHDLEAGNVERGITIATRLLSLDPLQENVHRSLMKLYCKQGRYAAALQQYRFCSDVLSEQLGVEPETSTKTLYREIREQRNKPHDKETGIARPKPQDQKPHIGAVRPLYPETFERRQITIMACDLFGLDALSAQFDPEELQPVLAAFKQTYGGIVSTFGGLVREFSGGGMIVCFGYPQAHEQSAERAIRAALALIDTVPHLDDDRARQVRARIGIATSNVVIGDLADEAESTQALVGEAPKLATLLQSAAAPGAVAIAEATRELVGDLFEYEPMEVALSGANGLAPAWRVVGESRNASRFDALRGPGTTTFVGRQPELELLLSRWQKAKASAGWIELIGGDAGIGKSRLARAFQERIACEPHQWLHYQCSPFHANSPLYPVVRQIEHTAGFATEDTPDQKLDRLETMLATSSLGVQETCPLFSALLSIPVSQRYPALTLSPAQQRRKTLAALLTYVERLALRSPLVMMFEDVHWADASTLEFLDLLVERIRQLPVLVLITHRPGFEVSWSCLDHVGILSLGGLCDTDIRSIIREMSSSRQLPSEVIAHIVHKTDGVPLFVEQLTKTVLESDALAAVAETDRGAPSLPAITIPATLRDSLMARLDRLASAKKIAQIGAVIGREFSHRLLETVARAPSQQLEEDLIRLTESGLLLARDSSAEKGYAFKHALIQDAAYETIAKSKRQNFHASIARALLEKFPDVAEKQPEILAHHYAEARMTAEALDFWLKAGKTAASRSANKEAIAHLEKGLVFLQAASIAYNELRRWELLFLAVIGPLVMAVHGYGAVESQNVFQRAYELMDDTTLAPERLQILCGLWNVRFHRGELEAALPLAQQCLAFAQKAGFGLDLANCVMGQTLSSMGEFIAAQRHFQLVIDNFRAGGRGPRGLFSVDEPVLALSYMARILWALGYPERSDAATQEAITLARKSSNSVSVAAALVGRMYMAIHGAPLPQAIACANEAIAFCKEHELTLFEHWMHFAHGALLVRQGETAAGIESMQSAISGAEARQSRQFRPFQLACMGAAYTKLGNSSQAMTMLDEGLSVAEAGGEKQSLAAIHRLRAELLFSLGRAYEARRALDTALGIARRQGARLEELRLAIAMVQHAIETDRAKVARKVLKDIYLTFGEGHELPEVRVARDLLSSFNLMPQ